jgi:multidrug resistance protein, MATE family
VAKKLALPGDAEAEAAGGADGGAHIGDWPAGPTRDASRASARVDPAALASADSPAPPPAEAAGVAAHTEPEIGDGPLTQTERATLRRQVLHLAWPVIVENVLQTMIGVVDTALVGHLTTDALAGVGGAQQLVWLVTTLLSAVMMGTTVLVGRAFGARRPADARLALKQSVLLAAGLSVILGAIIYGGAVPFMAWLGLDGPAASAGATYVQITALATPLLAGMFVGSAALRGSGDTRTPMFITLFINLVNGVLAWWLIYGFGPIPALGVAGSAWAASCARLIGCLALLWVFTRRRQALTLLGKGGWRFNWSLTRRMLNIGIPTALEQFFFSLGVTLYGIIVISLGTQVYATQRVSMNVVQLSLMPGFGFGMAATTLVAQALGAGRVRQAEAGAVFAMRSCVAQMTIAGAAFAIFAEPLMRIFTSDEAVVQLGTQVLRIIAFNQPFMAVSNVLAGALRGAGDTRFPMITSAIGIWLVRLPIGWFLGIVLGLGLQGIYMVYVADAAARAALVAWRWRQGKWKTMRV